MVRSNAHQQIGFLSNERRMNVAVTRAKRLCCLIGDSGTVSQNSFLASLCTYFKQHGQVRSAFDYAGNDDVRAGYGVRVTEKPQQANAFERDNAARITEDAKKMSKADRKKLKKEQERQNNKEETKHDSN